MQVVIETSMPLNDTEKAVLRLLLGEDAAVEPKPEPAPKPKRPKAEPKPAPVEEPEVDIEVNEPEEEVDGPEPGPTLDQAVTVATDMVSGGRREDVKAALAQVGVKRVGLLKGAQITEFLAALED